MRFLFSALFLVMTMALPLDPAAASDPDEALYLKRLSGITPQGLDSYDTLEAVPGAAHPRPLPAAASPSLPDDVLAQAKAYALANRSKALLIWRDGRLQASVYAPGCDATTPINARSMAKPLSAVAVGRAMALGAIRSLDQPAADFITEWAGTPKAAITIRELLDMTSGLAEQGPVKDPASIWTRAYLHPHHGDVMIQEYPLTAPPGTRYQYSNTSADLIAVILERATQRRYAAFVSDEVLAPIHAAGGSVWVDRPGGLAHSGCCILLPAETWLRLGLLVMQDGVWDGRRLLPEGFVGGDENADGVQSALWPRCLAAGRVHPAARLRTPRSAGRRGAAQRALCREGSLPVRRQCRSGALHDPVPASRHPADGRSAAQIARMGQCLSAEYLIVRAIAQP